MFVTIGRFDYAVERFLSTPMPSEKRSLVTARLKIQLVHSSIYLMDPEKLCLN